MDPVPAIELPAPVLLFDLDGTLTDSAPGIIAGFRHAMAAVGAPEPSDELLAAVVGPPMIDTFGRLGFDADRADRALRAYFDSYDAGGGWANNEVFAGIEPILADLTGRGIRLGVATSKSQRFAHRILDHFELARHFAFIGGASEDLVRRAKADVIAHTLRGLGIAPVPAAEGGTPGVAMVGDRDHDVVGAAQWGIPAIFVRWGYGSEAESAGAAWTVDDTTQLAEVLGGRTDRIA
ncbi:HAD hydrolase-like protein [Aldersonia sp. NBC_00410]|uniref:HAD hydrolase-like protein n=1 Tax=Aldersonia sp. NBC_00410 TaxID=2975954 RepID=UPI002251797D|nr:HAD hydrolase-like protein [Aldersonia sp. NBC_00410]MCX5042643.1 HAD hydrolase-like protein [Aldersonia sp. NBC_00410]